MVRERLDRFLCTEEWKLLFEQAWVCVLPRFCSDHSPIILFTEQIPRDKPRHHRLKRFESLWFKHDECSQIINNAWSNSYGEQICSRLEMVMDALHE